MTHTRLFTPGPTEVPGDVREVFSSPLIHHRSEEFQGVLANVRSKIAWLAGCSGEVVLFASSGTGGMEAALASLFSPGEEVVIVRGGKFGGRWVELAHHYKLETRIIDVEWGRAVSVESVEKALTRRTKGVLIQGCESSTGVSNPIHEIGHALSGRDELLFVVDGIMTLGIEDVDMDRDQIDVLVGASQKGLLSPPGLSLTALNQRAMERLASPGQSYYFSIARELSSLAQGRSGFTPAISHVRALETALGRLKKEGKTNLFARHRKLQQMARSSLKEMGFTLFNRDEEAAIGVTAVTGMPRVDLKRWLSDLEEKEGLLLAGGQQELAGKIFRIAHFGACEVEDLSWAINTIGKHIPRTAA